MTTTIWTKRLLDLGINYIVHNGRYKNEFSQTEKRIKSRSLFTPSTVCTCTLICSCTCTWQRTYRECVEFVTLKSINKLQLSNVGGDENPLTIVAELQPCPFASSIVLTHMKGGKWTLSKTNRSKFTVYTMLLGAVGRQPYCTRTLQIHVGVPCMTKDIKNSVHWTLAVPFNLNCMKGVIYASLVQVWTLGNSSWLADVTSHVQLCHWGWLWLVRSNFLTSATVDCDKQLTNQ